VLSCSKNLQTFSVRASFSPGNASFDLNEVAASAAILLKQHLFTFQPVSSKKHFPLTTRQNTKIFEGKLEIPMGNCQCQ
jgi:hypothetical protein